MPPGTGPARLTPSNHFFSLLVRLRQVDTAPVDDLVGGGLPAGRVTPLRVLLGDRGHLVDRDEGHGQAQLVLGSVLEHVVAPGRHHHRRQGLLHRPGPDGDGAELVVTPFPGEGLGLGQGLDDQVHALEEPPSAFGRVHAVGLVLVGCAAQKADDKATVGQVVQQTKLFCNPYGVVERQQVAQHGDLGFLAPLRHGRRHDRWRAGGDPAGVVVLREADPRKAHLFCELALFHAFLVAPHRGCGVVVDGGYWPRGGEIVPLRIPHGAKIGCLHHLPPSYSPNLYDSLRTFFKPPGPHLTASRHEGS